MQIETVLLADAFTQQGADIVVRNLGRTVRGVPRYPAIIRITFLYVLTTPWADAVNSQTGVIVVTVTGPDGQPIRNQAGILLSGIQVMEITASVDGMTPDGADLTNVFALPLALAIHARGTYRAVFSLQGTKSSAGRDFHCIQIP